MLRSVARRVLTVAVLLLPVLPSANLASAQVGPGLFCSPEDALFAASLNGSPLKLSTFPGGMFSIFGVPRTADVEIQSKFDVRWVQIRPMSAHVLFSIGPEHRRIHIKVSGTTPLTVEFNGSLAQVVHLFPYFPDANEPTGKQPGMLYFGPGVQSVGVLELHTGDVVYLAAGAWVKGAIRARYVHDVSIEGHGVLDGSDIKNHDAVYGGVSPIYFDNVQHARIGEILVYNSHGWTVTLRSSNGTEIDGLKILNPNAWNADDGIDVVSSSHVRISNIFVRTNDDCVAIKNLANVDTSDIQVRGAVLWNMPLGGNGLEIGFETGTSNIHGVTYDNIDMIHIERGAAISIHNGDSGSVSDVHFSNVRVEDGHRKLIDFAILYGAYGADRPTSQDEVRGRMDHGGAWDGVLCSTPEQLATIAGHRGQVKDITVTNLQVVDGLLPYSVIAGFDAQHPVRGVKVTDLSYQGKSLTSVASAKIVQEFAPEFVLR